ncbi:MAG: hypothetical protein E3J35_00225 [Methanomassiliicoccales archaeon]|nr:MAG: hypothetical protein E3J35_00225 [Methanomassiliicoccales archaeon]
MRLEEKLKHKDWGGLSIHECIPKTARWGLLESFFAEAIDITKGYEEILKEIAGGEFQKLQEEVKGLRKEIELLKGIKKVLTTEDALLEVWDNEYDEWWDSY